MFIKAFTFLQIMPNALDYLLLPIDERINYRHKQNLSLLGWYNSVVGNVEKVEGPISRTAARMRLGFKLDNIDRLVESGLLRTTDQVTTNYGTVLIDPDSLFEVEIMLRRTLPAGAIIKHFQLYSQQFYHDYSGLTINLNGKNRSHTRRLEFSDFSRIVFSFYEKERIRQQTRDFYTVRELADTLGINISNIPDYISKGLIEAVKINGGGKGGIYKIPPIAFFKAVDDYRRLGVFTGKEIYNNVSELAVGSGYSQVYILSLIRKGHLSATKFSERNGWGYGGKYLFTEQEFLDASDNLSKRKIDKSKYRTIDDVAEESDGYAPGTVSDLIRKGVISASKFARHESGTYVFDENQFLEAIAILNARAQLGTLYLPHQVRTRKRIEFQSKVKEASIDKEKVSFSVNRIHELSIKDELKLWMLTIQGNDKAFNELLRLYQPFIYKYAHYEFGPLSLDDRVAEGQLALWRVVTRSYNFAWARPRALLNIQYSIRSANRKERKLTNTGVRVRDLDNILVE